MATTKKKTEIIKEKDPTKVICGRCNKPKKHERWIEQCHCGTPTLYTPELLEKAQRYIDELPAGEFVHSVEGLAIHLDITRKTVYEWLKDDTKTKFCDIVDKVLQKQGNKLINSGLIGTFNSSITKLMLTKHGYRDSSEVLNTEVPVDEEAKKKSDDLIKEYLNEKKK